MVLVPALLMVSTIRFRSVKAIDVGWRRSYFALFIVAVVLALIASHPRLALVTLAYSYTVGRSSRGSSRGSGAGRAMPWPGSCRSSGRRVANESGLVGSLERPAIR